MGSALKYSRLCNELLEKELTSRLKSRLGFIVTDFLGVTANDMNVLRRKSRKAGAEYLVIRDRLSKRVFKKNGLTEMADLLQGECGIAFIGEDAALTSKIMLDFAKGHESFKIRGGYIHGTPVGIDRVRVLALLPPRNVLLAVLLASMKAPISGFVGVLGGVIKKLLYAMLAVKEKKMDKVDSMKEE